jgi:hypothetical protein
MSGVPRRSKRVVDEDAETPANGAIATPATGSLAGENGARPAAPPVPEPAAVDTPAPASPATEQGVDNGRGEPSQGSDLPRSSPANALAIGGQQVASDQGLYAILGLDPSVSDNEIQTTYRRQAAKLLGDGSDDVQALKQLNVAYEVLGNPVRRADYDRLRVTPAQLAGVPTTPIRPVRKTAGRLKPRRRPRQAVQPRYAGLGDVLVVLMVVGLAVLAGMLIIPRLSINLSALNAVQAVLPLSNNAKRIIEPTVTPTAATPEPTATPRPALAARFLGSTVDVSNPTPARNTPESVVIRLRRDRQPAANLDVWITVHYRTTEERWPPTGAVKTDASGAATITFNIGAATLNYPVTVNAFTRVEDQELTWSTTFTPH